MSILCKIYRMIILAIFYNYYVIHVYILETTKTYYILETKVAKAIERVRSGEITIYRNNG